MNKPKHLGTIVLWVVVVGIIVVIGLFLGLRVGKNTTYTPDSAVQQEQENNGYAVEQEPEPSVEPIVEIPETEDAKLNRLEKEHIEKERIKRSAGDYIRSRSQIYLASRAIPNLLLGDGTEIHTTEPEQNGNFVINSENRKKFKTSIDFGEFILSPTLLTKLREYYYDELESIDTTKKQIDRLRIDFQFGGLWFVRTEIGFQISFNDESSSQPHISEVYGKPYLRVNDIFTPWGFGHRDLSDDFWQSNSYNSNEKDTMELIIWDTEDGYKATFDFEYTPLFSQRYRSYDIYRDRDKPRKIIKNLKVKMRKGTSTSKFTLKLVPNKNLEIYNNIGYGVG